MRDGLNDLSTDLGISKTQLARLAHAHVNGNDEQYFFQLGKADIPPSSHQELQLKNGLDNLFHATNAPKETISKILVSTLILRDVLQLAQASGIERSLALDLGALTHNETDRFLELTKRFGIPDDKVEEILLEFKELAQQYDLNAAELDASLGGTALSIDIKLTEHINDAAATIGVQPHSFHDLANAVLTGDQKKFDTAAQKAGIPASSADSVFKQTKNSIDALLTNPAISSEKLTRFTEAAIVQHRIEEAGEALDLSAEQSIKLTAAYVDDGLEGFIDLAREYGFSRNSAFFNQLKTIEQQWGGKVALTLATNNVEDIVLQRQLIKDLGLQKQPITWPTIKQPPPPTTGGPDDNVANPGAAPDLQQVLTNTHRYVQLNAELTSIGSQISKLQTTPARLLLFPFQRRRINTQISALEQRAETIRNELLTLKQEKNTPSPAGIQKAGLQIQLQSFKKELEETRERLKTTPILRFPLRAREVILTTSIKALNIKIKQLEE